jgi:hypothetical protein
MPENGIASRAGSGGKKANLLVTLSDKCAMMYLVVWIRE